MTETQDIRTTNISKLSTFSNITKLTGVRKMNQPQQTTEVDPKSPEGKLSQKLDSIMSN